MPKAVPMKRHQPIGPQPYSSFVGWFSWWWILESILCLGELMNWYVWMAFKWFIFLERHIKYNKSESSRAYQKTKFGVNFYDQSDELFCRFWTLLCYLLLKETMILLLMCYPGEWIGPWKWFGELLGLMIWLTTTRDGREFTIGGKNHNGKSHSPQHGLCCAVLCPN